MNYHLIIKFGDTVMPVSPLNLRELTIVQDINKILPSFRLRIDDNSGLITHVFPFGKDMSSVYIELAQDETNTDKNAFTFTVYRRTPKNNQSTPSSDYDVIGMSTINGLFTPDHTRGFSGNISTTLTTVATELGVSNVDISPSLNYIKNILQPTWTNIQLLNFLKKNILGLNNEYGFRCFIKNYKFKNTFVFKSISEMVQNLVSYKFILSDQQYQDRYPIFNYSIYDNYKTYGLFASKEQKYSYFNYDTSEFVKESEVVTDYQSLSDYYLIDQEDTEDSNEINNTGRTNDFNNKFEGYIKGSYGTRLASLVKMYITTQGLPNICPGEIVETFFPQGVAGDNLYSYQYSGYWLVEKVIHNCGDVFLTKLLLTRSGLDTDRLTTLLPATLKKKI